MSVDEVPSEARLPTKHGEFNIECFTSLILDSTMSHLPWVT